MNQPNEESTSLKPGLKNRFSCFVRISVLWILFTSINGGIHAQNVATEGLKYPWAGGLNSCTFGSIDLNLDGKPDLVIFERFGNRILPFIQEGSAGTSNYTYHPEYASLFPDLHEWVEFADYNCDGKADIFTYYAGVLWRVFSCDFFARHAETTFFLHISPKDLDCCYKKTSANWTNRMTKPMTTIFCVLRIWPCGDDQR